jgi:hypothetical protein
MTEPERHLSAEDVEFLHRHAGVREATPRELAVLAARTAARDARERQHTRSLPAVAALLDTSEHEVLGMTAAGSLYSYTLAGGAHRYPSWQFAYGRMLPHLHEVVAAFPAGSHPTGIRTVMTTPSPDLMAEVPLDHPVQPLIPEIRVSPADWLSGGCSPTPVLALLAVFAGAI